MLTKAEFKELLTLKPAQIFAAGFAVIILIGALLLDLPIATVSGDRIGFIDALFTSTSAVCVTGLVVVDTGTYFSRFGQIVILLLIQIGGLGFMTMGTMIAFLAGKKISLKNRLLMQKALGYNSLAGVIRLVRRILLGTFIVEMIGAVFLSFTFIPVYGVGKGIFFSLFHSVSAFCNAGFDLIGNGVSLIPFQGNPIVVLTICMLVVVGGLGFTAIFDILEKRKFKKLSLNTKIVLSTTAILLILGFVAVLVFEWGNKATLGSMNLSGRILAALFHSVTPRTAGFNTLVLTDLSMSVVFVTIMLMFVGGSPSSTAGGIKTTTLATLVISVRSIVKGREDSNAFHRKLPMEAIKNATAVFSISMALVVLVTLFLTVTEPNHSLMEILFETVSAFATVGLSLGITPELSVLGKLIVALTMFAGRIGPITLVLALTGAKESTRTLYHYPEDKITIG